MNSRQRPTLRAIADRVGVSPATASYALQGKGTLKDETRARVISVARELGYPVPVLEPMVRRLGVLFPAHFQHDEAIHRHEIYAQFARGIERALSSVDGCIVTYAPNSPGSFLFQHLRESGVEGLIFFGVDVDHESVQATRAWQVPSVLLNHRGALGISSVGVANHAAMSELTGHLLEHHGYRQIAYLKGAPCSYTTDRLAGARAAYAQRGLDPTHMDVISYGTTVERSMERILSLLPGLEAVIVDRAVYSVQLIELLKKKGYRVPDDVAVVCFDDLKATELATPSLTTIGFDAEELAYRAADLLISIIRGETAEAQILLPYRLIVRTSCGCTVRSD